MSDALPRWVLLAGLVIAAGCQSEADPAADEAAVVAPAAAMVPARAAVAPPVASPAAKPAAKPATAPELADPKVTSAQAASFAPPFPDRFELFEPSKNAQNSARRDDEHGETVELKGFINVDQPRVVLSIDGVISPVAEGDEKYGVQVISIQPPSVVLQRGRNRWKATVE